jgi:hypothetical protein
MSTLAIGARPEAVSIPEAEIEFDRFIEQHGRHRNG